MQDKLLEEINKDKKNVLDILQSDIEIEFELMQDIILD